MYVKSVSEGCMRGGVERYFRGGAYGMCVFLFFSAVMTRTWAIGIIIQPFKTSRDTINSRCPWTSCFYPIVGGEIKRTASKQIEIFADQIRDDIVLTPIERIIKNTTAHAILNLHEIFGINSYNKSWRWRVITWLYTSCRSIQIRQHRRWRTSTIGRRNTRTSITIST